MRVGHGRVVPAGGAWPRWRVDLPEVVGRNDGRGGGSEADHGAECAGGTAFAAVEGDGAGVVALGEAFAVVVADQVVVVVDRRAQAEQVLQQDVDAGGLGEVGAADHVVIACAASSTTTARW